MICLVDGRSREGAWIEIRPLIINVIRSIVAPARERGLKFKHTINIEKTCKVAPARERGLKY